MQFMVGQSNKIDTRNESNQRVDADKSPRHLAPEHNNNDNNNSPKMTTSGKGVTKFESTADGNVVIVEPSFDEEDAIKKGYMGETPVKSSVKKPVHKRDLSAHFFDATRLSDGIEYGKSSAKRETSYPIQHARTSNGFAVPIPRASPARISDNGAGVYEQAPHQTPVSPHANVGNKHRRGFSGGRSNPAVAHRRINSVGDSTPVDRQGYNGYYPPPRSGYTHRREDSAGLDILSAAANETKDKSGFDDIQQRDSRRIKGIWDAPVETSQVTERRMDPPQPVDGPPSYDHHHHGLPPMTYSGGRLYSFPPPTNYPAPHGHTQGVPYTVYPHHETFYPPGRYHPHHGYQTQRNGASYPIQYVSVKEGISYSRSNPFQHPVHNYEHRPQQRLDTDELHFRKDNPERNAAISTGNQTFSTAINVGDENRTVIPAPAQRTTSTNIDQNVENPPIPTSVGHHRKLSSYSSLGALIGNSIFQDPEHSLSVSSSRGHHRSNSSSVSLLQGLDADGDMFFLPNIHTPTNGHGILNPSTKSYINSRPLETTSQINVLSNNETSGRTLAVGGTSKRIRRKCTVDGCNNRVVQGGLCISHGAKRKTCKHPGCTKNVKKAGLCSTHGPARKRCEHEGCTKVAVQGGKCIAHGAKKKLCKISGCTKQAILTGMCKKHHDAHTITSSSRGKANAERCIVIKEVKSISKKPTHTRGLSIFQEISAESVQTLLSAESNNAGRHPLKDN